MTQAHAPRRVAAGALRRYGAGALLLTAALAGSGWIAARTAWATPMGQAQVAGPAWSSLSPAQQAALAPLQPTWNTNDGPRKMKWIEVADRFPRMPADERQRVQERMAAWAALTPAERERARVQFQETRRVGPEERQARWQAYQALPEDERKRLAQAAQASQAGATRVATARSIPASPGATAPGAAQPKAGASAAKSNLVTAAPAPPLRAVAPTVVQAKPGASTRTVATPAKPPLHHQPGLPKIVSTPNFVDPNTLLPRRGPQAAAMRAAASSDPTQQP